MRLIIDRPTLSLNRLMRMHWAARSRLKDHYRWQIKANKERIRAEGRDDWKAKGKRKVTVTRLGRMKLDRDNFIGGTKPLVDALVNEGLLVDDSPKYVEVTYQQRIITPTDGRTCTVVDLEDCE